MTDRNKNRPGYKETKAGWIPEEWNIVKLTALTSTSIQNGYSPNCPNEATGKFVLGLGALSEHGFDDTQIKPAPANDKRVDDFFLKSGDFLISRSNTPNKVGLSALYSGEISNCSYPDLMMRFRVKTETVYPKYLAAYLKRAQATRYFQRAASGTSSSMVKITKKDVQRIPTPLPSLAEQEAIAEVLGCWDEGIETIEKLIDEKKLRKKGLMQKLLSGEKRLPGYSEDWNEVRIKEILTPRNTREPQSPTVPLYSLTIENGITPKTDRYNREALVMDKQGKKYKRVEPQDIVYNPANLRWGAIGRHKEIDTVLVSPIYEVLRVTNKENTSGRFVYDRLSWERQIRMFAARVEGSLIERMAVKLDAFLLTKIEIPATLDEQKAIAEVLETADEEIRLLEAERDALCEQKKGLMQKLLTGEKRLPAFV